MKTKEKIACKICGSIFQPRRYDHKFCSNACRTKAHRQEHGIVEPSFLLSPPKHRTKLVESVETKPVVHKEANPKYINLKERHREVVQFSNKLEYQRNQVLGDISTLKGQTSGKIGFMAGFVVGYALGFGLLTKTKTMDTKVGDYVRKQKKSFGFIVAISFGVIGGLVGYLVASKFYLSNNKAKKQAALNEALVKLATIENQISENRSRERKLIDEIEITDAKITILKENSPEIQDKKQPNKTKAMPMDNLRDMKFKALTFSDKWSKLMGNPENNFYMTIYGQAGHGKSHFTIEFSEYLAKNFGKVLFNSSEEGISLSLKNKIINFQTANIYLGEAKTINELKSLIEDSPYKFVVIDSVNDMKITSLQLKELKERHGIGIIAIQQSTKDGKFKGGNEFRHDCDIAIKIENRAATCEKTRYL